MAAMDISEHKKFSSLYNNLWQDAKNYFANGEVQTDPHLLDIRSDKRRGLTIIARPGQEVVQQFLSLVHTLRSIEPKQYYYVPNQFHLTVLTLFTATTNFTPFFDKIPEYRNVFKSILSDKKCFQIVFKGITASRSSIMIQGFTHETILNQLRDQLRDALQKSGLGKGLDTRYRLNTAHTTIMRFKEQPQNLRLLLDTLERFRKYDFGQTTIRTLQWVKNDWYMSPENVEVLEEYHLVPIQHSQ